MPDSLGMMVPGVRSVMCGELLLVPDNMSPTDSLDCLDLTSDCLRFTITPMLPAITVAPSYNHDILDVGK